MSEYADKDRLEPYYSKHVDAMTVEGLPKISEIAAELAFRDRRIEKLEIRELGYIQSLRDLEARVRELERQNSLLLEDVQGIAEAVIPYCDASDFAYAVKRDCAETLKAIATKAE